MQLANGAQFLNTTYIPLFPMPAANFMTVTVPLTSMYASLESHNFDLSI